ncbi:ABC transporter ATP-binding protein [Marivirga sp.]|uniref:ABC transporter ATP-binding protein n=1 Tax=Marivirga sp. TaxID=2018662 RepID=UPI0025E4236A|nr:ABC transporter ATP-binding protein [Marivirga sp.]
MSDIVLKVENLSKLYRLGEVGTGTISHDLNRWWAKIRGNEDPFGVIGSTNDRTQKAEKGESVWAIKGINFEVKKGEVLGIIGKNGAGKSTLLKVLSKITAPTTGNIKIKGRVASLLEVGTGMHPEMTGKENVYLNGTILGMTKKEIDSKFEEIMEFAGCAKYADTPVKRYSSGMKVRLGFAVAAFLEPEILIVDEVLAVGDAEFQKKAIGKMKDISSGGGRTVLFVSHNMGSIRKLCNRGVLLVNGEISYSGNIEAVIDNYLSEGKGDLGVPLVKFKESNGVFQPIQLQIKNRSSDELTNTFSSDHAILIQFSYRTTEELHNMRIVLAILAQDDQILFTYSSHSIEPALKEPGEYVVSFTIQPELFNTGNYKIRLHAGQPGIQLLMKPDIVGSFSVEKFQKSSNYNPMMPGYFAPELEASY